MRRRSIPVVGLLLLVPAFGAGMSYAAGAQAATPASATACSTVTAKVSSPSGELSGCTVATTGGSGVIREDGAKTGDIVTWANGGTTTFKFGKSTLVKPDACPSGHAEEHLAGTVTGSTGAAAGISGSTSAYVCIPRKKHGEVSLLAGTVWKF